ncbi:MAG TPA: MauE/DoxX family redox-associated membrane protein [Steroidobacteraceae bacterium]|nr:MauE/DoxX family redox-associated membrane protein [Steroidobacteraceae bacterium]
MPSPTVDPAIAALILACNSLLFAGAAVHKLRDLRRFDEIFRAYGLLPWFARLHGSRLVPLIEAGVAAALLVPATRTVAAAVGAILLLAYACAIGVNLRRGRRDLACGCGGPDDRRPIAGWMIWRNILLALLLGVVTLPWSARSLEPTDGITIVGGALTCALVYLCLDRLLGRTGRMTAELRLSR